MYSETHYCVSSQSLCGLKVILEFGNYNHILYLCYCLQDMQPEGASVALSMLSPTLHVLVFELKLSNCCASNCKLHSVYTGCTVLLYLNSVTSGHYRYVSFRNLRTLHQYTCLLTLHIAQNTSMTV